MQVIIRVDAEAAALFAARLIATRLAGRPALVLGLATGRTPERVYAELARLHRDEALDFSRCTTFNLDEYVGLAPSDPDSYRAFMERHLFSRVNIHRERTHLPDGLHPDENAAAAVYEAAIQAAGGIDLQLLGIGETGHIGFNEPGSSLASRTRSKTLMPRTRQQNAALFGGDPASVPSRAITMGVGTICDARELLLLATGAGKAAILAAALEGAVTATVPASAVQFHPACVVVADADAAARLALRDYHEWVFANEPEWVPFRDGGPYAG